MGGRGQSFMSAHAGTRVNVDDLFLSGLSFDEHRITKDVMRRTGLGAKEANVLGKAIWDWSGSGYRGVRGYQQGLEGYDENKDQSESVERFLELAPKWGTSGVTYRGIAMHQEDFNELVKGAEVNMRGTSSWSTSRDRATYFAKTGAGEIPVLFISSSQGKGVDIHAISKLSYEQEVLVSKDARWSVKKKPKKVKGIYVVEVEEI